MAISLARKKKDRMAGAGAKEKDQAQVTLDYQGECAGAVFVAGGFNDWNPTRDQLARVGTDGLFRTTLALPKGRHEYKFVVDNLWCTDPRNPECVANDQGSMNSVLNVQ